MVLVMVLVMVLLDCVRKIEKRRTRVTDYEIDDPLRIELSNNLGVYMTIHHSPANEVIEFTCENTIDLNFYKLIVYSGILEDI
jgi:hypothetical protein